MDIATLTQKITREFDHIVHPASPEPDGHHPGKQEAESNYWENGTPRDALIDRISAANQPTHPRNGSGHFHVKAELTSSQSELVKLSQRIAAIEDAFQEAEAATDIGALGPESDEGGLERRTSVSDAEGDSYSSVSESEEAQDVESSSTSLHMRIHRHIHHHVAKVFKPDPKPSILSRWWGGPMQPKEDDSVGSWVNNHFQNVSTAHGLNEAANDDSKPLRTIWWTVLFIGCFVLLVIQLRALFEDFFFAKIATNIEEKQGVKSLPMLTVCNPSRIRCGCEAFYDAAISGSAHIAKVLPFLCSSAISFNPLPNTDPLTGEATDMYILENITQYVDVPATATLMAAFTDTINCDSPGYTKAKMVEKIIDGTLTSMEMYQYAGYGKRQDMIRRCMSRDAGGKKISCMSDKFWGPARLTEDNGMCHTFNPCFGFPVGNKCTKDSTCSHRDKLLPGGKCVDGFCDCTRCAAGGGCASPPQQVDAGNGNGVRIVANAAIDQSPVLLRTVNSKFTNAMTVLIHNQESDGMQEMGRDVAPQFYTEWTLVQRGHEEAPHPYTNCSQLSFVDPGVCRQRCLQREQAKVCCAIDSPQIVAGKATERLIPDMTGAGSAKLSNPVLECPMLSTTLEECLDVETQRFSHGEICVEGAAQDETGYFGGALKRIGWYDGDGLKDQDKDWVSDQEEKMMAIAKQCIWPTELGEAYYGKECKLDADCQGNVQEDGSRSTQGKCADGTRAFCPPLCRVRLYAFEAEAKNTLSPLVVDVIAREELVLATAKVAAQGAAIAAGKVMKPACGAGNDTADCFTEDEARSYVLQNYAMFSAAYSGFSEVVTKKGVAVDFSSLMGSLGGNLGMWVGMSVMTIMELFELVIWAFLCIPFFWFGIKLSHVKRVKKEDAPKIVSSGASVPRSKKPAASQEASWRMPRLKKPPGETSEQQTVKPEQGAAPASLHTNGNGNGHSHGRVDLDAGEPLPVDPHGHRRLFDPDPPEEKHWDF